MTDFILPVEYRSTRLAQKIYPQGYWQRRRGGRGRPCGQTVSGSNYGGPTLQFVGTDDTQNQGSEIPNKYAKERRAGTGAPGAMPERTGALDKGPSAKNDSKLHIGLCAIYAIYPELNFQYKTGGEPPGKNPSFDRWSTPTSGARAPTPSARMPVNGTAHAVQDVNIDHMPLGVAVSAARPPRSSASTGSTCAVSASVSTALISASTRYWAAPICCADTYALV